ncbi:calcitonin gene-related peptide type 1 receptor-like [Mytilus californianus]|uniref:calcitonin gene-related peptide type 1 receptor-like n=1 Tax=Mytilus californianus TaxID=6549 RepID=UPI002246842F|nr:calcitonin gene-related peptide type 1 receptor-like [Mytilus californianus]
MYEQLYCNGTFDGYTCWNYTKAGTKTYGYCPLFMVEKFGQQPGQPFKECNTDGTWYKHPNTQRSWTNYAPCSDTMKVQRANNVLYAYFSGYGVSIVVLIVALLILAYFRQLKCTRITIHKHLFVSYILTAVFWITYYASTSFDPHVVADNPVWCRILHVLSQYVTVCNYAWMFCEGFYLHTVLVLTFTNEKTLLKICYVVGWGIPVVPSAVYTVLRSTNEDVNNSCWHDDTILIWTFSGPIALSLLINVIFLMNIIRILCSKVNANRPQSLQSLRQSLKATCILIPLLGIQYIALPFRPNDGNEHGKYVYDMASACLSSFQGFLVSLLFCFLNGEVLSLLKSQIKMLQRCVSYTETLPSYMYASVYRSEGGKHITDTELKEHIIEDKQVEVDFSLA